MVAVITAAATNLTTPKMMMTQMTMTTTRRKPVRRPKRSARSGKSGKGSMVDVKATTATTATSTVEVVASQDMITRVKAKVTVMGKAKAKDTVVGVAMASVTNIAVVVAMVAAVTAPADRTTIMTTAAPVDTEDSPVTPTSMVAAMVPGLELGMAMAADCLAMSMEVVVVVDMMIKAATAPIHMEASHTATVEVPAMVASLMDSNNSLMDNSNSLMAVMLAMAVTTAPATAKETMMMMTSIDNVSSRVGMVGVAAVGMVGIAEAATEVAVVDTTRNSKTIK